MSQGEASHLRGGYLVRNPMLWSYLRATDGVLRLLAGREPQSATAQSTAAFPRRILLAIGGHLGDAIVASRALDLLANGFPNAAFGIVTPSWAKVVLDHDRRISWSHTVDHWRINRSARPLRAKVAQYLQTSASAVSEIAAIEYDVAFDLYPYYPNMAGVLWRAGIPRRYGYASGGRGALYTTALAWVDDRCHISEKQIRLIRSAFPQLDSASTPAPRLAPPAEKVRADASRLLSDHGVTGAYAILHAGVGDAARRWPVSAWRDLAERLTATMNVVLTGAGPTEVAAASAIADGLPRCFNLAGELDWRALEAVVEAALVVVAGETSLGHLAAAHRTPGVAIYSGVRDTREWQPLGARDVPLVVLSDAVSASPDYRPSGDGATEIARGVTVDLVAEAVARVLVATDLSRSGSTAAGGH